MELGETGIKTMVLPVVGSLSAFPLSLSLSKSLEGGYVVPRLTGWDNEEKIPWLRFPCGSLVQGARVKSTVHPLF